MARLLFLTTLMAAAVVYAAANDTTAKKALSVAYSCDKKCTSCYPTDVEFTPGECQKVEDDFSYKATCAESGAWTLKTYRGVECGGSEVYSFGGDKDTCQPFADKHTNVKIVEITADNVKFTLCPFKSDKQCAEADTTTEGCFTQTVKATAVCEKGTGDGEKYYYSAKVNSDKASLAVFSTKAECEHKVLPLTRLVEKEKNACVSYQHHVKAACEDVVEENTLAVAHDCDAGCGECYPNPTGFVIADTCQKKDGEDFSYKATCTEAGAWALTTYRDNACGDSNKVYEFSGSNGNEGECATYDKYTNVQFTDIKDGEVKFKLCPLQTGKQCTGESCIEQTVQATEKCVQASGTDEDKKYYYSAKVVESKKASLAVFSTKAECEHKGLSLARLVEEKKEDQCLSYQQRVHVMCEKGAKTTTTTTNTTSNTGDNNSTGDDNNTGDNNSTGGNSTGDNNTDSSVAGVASLVAASVTAAAIAMLF